MKLKKPEFWDYKKPNLLSYILLPFTFPILINNFLLNAKKNKKNFEKIKKICVGNIYVGGTAKTPLTIKIYQILDDLGFEVATIIKNTTKIKLMNKKYFQEKTKMYCFKSRREALDRSSQEIM